MFTRLRSAWEEMVTIIPFLLSHAVPYNGQSLIRRARHFTKKQKQKQKHVNWVKEKKNSWWVKKKNYLFIKILGITEYLGHEWAFTCFLFCLFFCFLFFIVYVEKQVMRRNFGFR